MIRHMSSSRSSSVGLDSRVSTIASITNALKFFALALLIVEALIGILAIQAPLHVLTLSYLGTTMFIFVVTMVVIHVLKKPEALLAARARELQREITQKVSKVGDLGRKKEVVQNSFSREDLNITPVEEPQIIKQSSEQMRS